VIYDSVHGIHEFQLGKSSLLFTSATHALTSLGNRAHIRTREDYKSIYVRLGENPSEYSI